MQGHKVREIAQRLAMSESDLYRKQRIAVEAVAASLSKMEERVSESAEAEQISEPAALPKIDAGQRVE